jgi:hypothetical protein
VVCNHALTPFTVRRLAGTQAADQDSGGVMVVPDGKAIEVELADGAVAGLGTAN